MTKGVRVISNCCHGFRIRVVWVERDLKDHLVPTPLPSIISVQSQRTSLFSLVFAKKLAVNYKPSYGLNSSACSETISKYYHQHSQI